MKRHRAWLDIMALQLAALLAVGYALALDRGHPSLWSTRAHRATSVVLSPDGRMLAASFADASLRVFDLRARRLAIRLAAGRVAFSTDGRWLVRDAAGRAVVLSTRDGTERASVAITPDAFGTTSTRWQLTPDATELAVVVGSDDDTTRIGVHRLPDLDLRTTFTVPESPCWLSPGHDREVLTRGGIDSSTAWAALLDVDTGELRGTPANDIVVGPWLQSGTRLVTPDDRRPCVRSVRAAPRGERGRRHRHHPRRLGGTPDHTGRHAARRGRPRTRPPRSHLRRRPLGRRRGARRGAGRRLARRRQRRRGRRLPGRPRDQPPRRRPGLAPARRAARLARRLVRLAAAQPRRAARVRTTARRRRRPELGADHRRPRASRARLAPGRRDRP